MTARPAERVRAAVWTVVRASGWLLLAYVVGWLVAAATSTGRVGFVVGAAGLLAAVVVVPRLGDRWPLLGERLLRASLLLAGLAVLVAANRNTPVGLAPVRWMAVVLATAAMVVAMAAVVRERRGGSTAWRAWGLLVLAGLVLTGVAVDGFAGYRTEAVAVTNGDVRLRGTLLMPRGQPPFPLVAFVHGAGPEWGFMSRHLADRIAREGVAALMWDKRGTGASVGGSPRDDFAALASDVVAWVGHLQGRGDIDGDRIGLWGSSEGPWVAALAAQQLDGVAALVLISPGVGFGDTLAYQMGWEMRNAGYSDAQIDRALVLNRRVNDYYRSGHGRTVLLAELRAATDEEWYAAAVDFGLLPLPNDVTEPNDPQTIAHLQQWDFTLLTPLADHDGPVLAAVGLQDRTVPPRAGADAIETALAGAGNDHRVLRYPQAGHMIVVWLTGEPVGGPGIPPLWYPAGYVDETTGWLADKLQG